MADDLQKLNQVLRPVAQPRVLEGVYTDDQYERIMRVIKRNGPWPTITAHHFDYRRGADGHVERRDDGRHQSYA